MFQTTHPQEPIVPSKDLFNAVSDEMRLKILMILDRSEFTVNELKDALDIHQSNASRHLAKLSACALLKDRREGTKAFYGLSDDLYMSPRLLEMLREAWKQLPDYEIIQSKIEETLSERRNNYSAKFHKLDEVGGSLKAQIGLFSKLMFPFEHAIDVGCGEGADLSFMMAHRCKTVTAVDIQPSTIQGVEQLAREKNVSNIRALVADMAKIPLPNACADLVLMSQALHHAASPLETLKEAIRLLKPGGILALLDLALHNEEELRETHGHIWLGFDGKRIAFLLKDLPCRIIDTEIIPSERSELKKLPAICFIVRKE
ncbi:MAG: metalloregulator ArsR/SmtB family transcription factor [Fibrobacter sp.]|nr:metalloregulator ArsR/SmtB family transcription factor [Fibrobacter sp.]